jgi:hypothetical protein
MLPKLSPVLLRRITAAPAIPVLPTVVLTAPEIEPASEGDVEPCSWLLQAVRPMINRSADNSRVAGHRCTITIEAILRVAALLRTEQRGTYAPISPNDDHLIGSMFLQSDRSRT